MMNQPFLPSWTDKLLNPLQEIFQDMYQGIIDALPNLFLAITILLVGYFIATTMRKFIAKFLTGIKFDDILEKAGVASLLKKLGLNGSPSAIISKAVFWIIVLFIFKNAAGKLGIEDISNIIDSIMAFLPKVMVAGIIMLVGFMVADLVQNAVQRALDNLGLDYAKALANILFGFIFIIVLTVALSQLGIETELLNASVKIILAALGLGLAICLGLGLKGLANQIISGVYARDIYQVGTEIEYDNEPAKVAGVGPVTTKLQRQDGGFIMVPNHELVSKSVRGKSADQTE